MRGFFWDHRPAVFRKILSCKKRIIFLDFDGTLAPISSDPQAVKIDPGIKRILRTLSRRPSFRIVVVSGRALSDVRRRVGLRNLTYVGNHGFEISSRGGVLPSKFRQAGKEAKTLRMICSKLNSLFKSWPGVWVEDKNFTLSLHFRNLNSDDRPMFDQIVKYQRRDTRALPVVWRSGKKVWEIRPKKIWGKGEAALYLYRFFGAGLPIVIGDDKTDEDMFGVFNRRGITIRVGHLKKTKAGYFLKSTGDVLKFLSRIEEETR